MSINDSDEAGEVVGAAAGDPDAGLRRPAKKASSIVFFFLAVLGCCSLRTWWGGRFVWRGCFPSKYRSKRRRKKRESRNDGKKRERGRGDHIKKYIIIVSPPISLPLRPAAEKFGDEYFFSTFSRKGRWIDRVGVFWVISNQDGCGAHRPRSPCR
jgi:hypothetical protein